LTDVADAGGPLFLLPARRCGALPAPSVREVSHTATSGRPSDRFVAMVAAAAVAGARHQNLRRNEGDKPNRNGGDQKPRGRGTRRIVHLRRHDYQTALAEAREFLSLFPKDPLAAQMKQQEKSLLQSGLVQQ